MTDRHTSAGEVFDWLQSLGLAEHAAAFAAQGITLDLLPELDDADLKELGVALLGHRRRLRAAIAALSATSTAGAAAVRPRDAERRQLTVMFCDLVGSTQLAGQLDPEDLQRVIRSYHAAVADAVAPFAGHMAQLLGDGCLVYFGYPSAHEDDASRAVHAALAVLGAVAALPVHGGQRLQTRIGIATGLVVVGEVGSGTAAVEQTASGETPNLAARLQAHAAPGEVVMSDETRRLVGAAFELDAVGPLALKGFAAPIPAWRVRGQRSVASRFEAQHESALVEFVGRASEVALLLERWQLARDGEGQVVLLSGEAGIGKSRIVQTLRDRLAAERHATVLMQCSPYHVNSALFPLVQYFERTAGIAATDAPAERARKLERLVGPGMGLTPQSATHLARLLGALPAGKATSMSSTSQEKAQTLQAPIDLLRALAAQLPVLLLIEDAHWIDPTTAELVAATIEQSRDARLLVLVTCRPESAPAFAAAANLTRLALNRLGQRQSAELATAAAGGRALPEAVLAQIVARTDGIPLFVEELTKTVLQSGLLEDTPTGWRLRGPLPALAIPATLQDSLMARLDRLAPAKEVAQVGAMIGREFSRSLLAEVLQMAPDRLDAALDELLRAELVVRRGIAPDERYSFRHALIRDTAYNSLLKGQRVLRHAQIAAALESLEPDTVAGQPELVAYHCQEGGMASRALRYWRDAARLAIERLTNREAVMHLRAALALLPELTGQGRAGDEEPQDVQGIELELQMSLGSVLMQTEGYASPPTMAAFVRGRELALRLGRGDEVVIACAAFGASLWAAGRYDEELELLEQTSAEDLALLRPMSRVFHSVVLGLLKFHLGAIEEASTIVEGTFADLAAVPAAERQDISGVDPRVLTLTQAISIRVHQGRLDDADAHCAEAMRIAAERDHEPTWAWAYSMERWKAFRHGDWATAIGHSRSAMAIAERLGFSARLGTGKMLLGRSLVAAGEVDEGVRLLDEGYALWSADGSPAGSSELAASAADVLLEAGRLDAAEAFVRIGEATQAAIPERFFAAELTRLRARLTAAAGDPDAAERGLREALAIAERQGARLHALRAATDLARLTRSSARAAEGQVALEGALRALPQGHDQPDAVRARALLRSLSGEA